MKTVYTDVLVVGAGPAGLTAAALFARSGVQALTLTKYGTADAPRAHITNQRAVEVFRDLGIEQRVVDRALPNHLMGKQVFATGFAGRELSRIMSWGTADERLGDYRAASPCDMVNIAQHTLEPMLLDRARELGADIRQHTEVLSVRQTPDRVIATARPREGGETFEVVARYAIGCDGARTIVGQEGAFEFEKSPSLGHAVTVWIEADLTRYTAHRSGALFFTLCPQSDDMVGVWTCVEPWTEWSTIFLKPELQANDLDEATVAENIRAAIGDDSVEFKIKKVSPWQFNHVVASTYRKGRLFIAGDAAHRHPPANGLGSNTSIQDAYNLAWKMALVVRGKAGDALLDSYSAERQPVGRQVVDRANKSAADMFPWLEALGLLPGMDGEQVDAQLERVFGPDGALVREKLFQGLALMNEQFNAHGVELGQYYRHGAVVPDGTAPAPAERDPVLYYQRSTSPGAKLPHAWLVENERNVSTLDLCHYEGFTLITGAAGHEWQAAAARVSEAFDVQVNVVPVSIGAEQNDGYGEWFERREIEDAGCLLVRPDRVVAWRCMGQPENAVAQLHEVMATLLCTGPGGESQATAEIAEEENETV